MPVRPGRSGSVSSSPERGRVHPGGNSPCDSPSLLKRALLSQLLMTHVSCLRRSAR